MKRNVIIFCFLILLFSTTSVQAKFPVHLGGFTLGEDMTQYHHLINMETCREVPFNRYLVEGETLALPGFKSGQIAYGVCDKPNKIVRIKLKFADSSKKFFEKLLNSYKKQLGEPSEYRGDPFQTFIAWKWSFTNDQNERTSLILQHNIMVEDEKVGTSVKLTLTSQIEKERNCFTAKFPEKTTPGTLSKKKQEALWKQFVPYE